MAFLEHNSNIHEYASNVSYWPQKKGSSLISIYNQDDICAGLEARLGNLRRKGDKSLVQELQWLIEEFNLEPHLLKHENQSSYGETRRIELATALSSHSILIIADEPFDGLDEYWVEVLRRTIKTTTEQFNCIWIITGNMPASYYFVKPDKELSLKENDSIYDVFAKISKEVIKRMDLHNHNER